MVDTEWVQNHHEGSAPVVYHVCVCVVEVGLCVCVCLYLCMCVLELGPCLLEIPTLWGIALSSCFSTVSLLFNQLGLVAIGNWNLAKAASLGFQCFHDD